MNRAIFSLCLILAGATALAAPLRTIDCHQGGDGFNDFTLVVEDAKSATLTVDTFHTPVLDLLPSLGNGVDPRLARITFTTYDPIALSKTDPLLVQFIGTPTKVEILDWSGKLLKAFPNPPLSDVRLNAIHGKSSVWLPDYEGDTVFYEVEISNKSSATVPFHSIVGRHWLTPGECKTNQERL